MKTQHKHQKIDKSWLLNPTGVAAAKRCIHAVDAELGIRLKLSHPDFIGLLIEYAELTEDPELSQAVQTLLEIAPQKIQQSLAQAIAPKVVKLENKAPISSRKNNPEETISYQGKHYPRFQDGKEFKGLYRGQARYV